MKLASAKKSKSDAALLDRATDQLLRVVKARVLKKDGRADHAKLRREGYNDRFLPRLESEQWIKRFKARLKRRGFIVRDITPAESAAAKRRNRRADRSRIARGQATPGQVQAANSLFPEASARGRVLGFRLQRPKA
jgi:hypothetical protein